MDEKTSPEENEQQPPPLPQDTEPKGKPEQAAGSINPREKAPFYEAVIKKGGKGKRR